MLFEECGHYSGECPCLTCKNVQLAKLRLMGTP